MTRFSYGPEYCRNFISYTARFGICLASSSVIPKDVILVFFHCLSWLYTISMAWKLASLLCWWQGSSFKCSKYQCKLSNLVQLILPGINDEALTETLHLENVLPHACLMLLEVLDKREILFLSSETAYSVSLHYICNLLEFFCLSKYIVTELSKCTTNWKSSWLLFKISIFDGEYMLSFLIDLHSVL